MSEHENMVLDMDMQWIWQPLHLGSNTIILSYVHSLHPQPNDLATVSFCVDYNFHHLYYG